MGEHMSTLKLRRRSTVAAGLATLALVLGAAAVPAQATEKTKYVALGDSYAAGQGAGPYLDSCFRSENSYAELADEAKSIKLVTNAACSGKTTQQVVTTQLRKLNKSTELVTITAGGNNLRAGDLFKYCGAALLDPTAAPLCDNAIAFASAEIQSERLAGDVASLIQSVRAAAPKARIVVTGYPYLYDPVVPNPADSLSVFIYRATGLVDGLNGSIRAAAQGPRVEYVDVREAFSGHGLNSATPWINLNVADPTNAGNFHPNAAGYKAYYAALKTAGVF
jgi:lysophospholipase L1-like esterase